MEVFIIKNRVLIYAKTYSSLVMVVAYDLIERGTGAEPNMLLFGAVITIVLGLYFGLRKDNETTED